MLDDVNVMGMRGADVQGGKTEIRGKVMQYQFGVDK
jgi:hypothetical protein